MAVGPYFVVSLLSLCFCFAFSLEVLFESVSSFFAYPVILFRGGLGPSLIAWSHPDRGRKNTKPEKKGEHNRKILPRAKLEPPKIKASEQNSATGTRTRVARVRAEYPNQLDYSGFCSTQSPELSAGVSAPSAE